MGVAKFYRWISARYPCINQALRPGEIPIIDYLYLDMNGILHTCSHPAGSSQTLTEDAIFRDITLYIKFLFKLIKPRKVLFLAVDGVAPRAKMTQQRARRFQSALEAKIAKQNSTTQNGFDSCLISPGTAFMERLHNHLKDFVKQQRSVDMNWKSVDIIFSGHDCPGEGEHKIREYMAYQRGLPEYIPNERHCIYGMDADLIFLGLTTHELNLCILRENVVENHDSSAENKPFCITYLSVLREYIELEFNDLKSLLSFPFDLERLIDDWIFMAFLLGNDFIPHIPNLHIHAESLITLWDTYQVTMPQLDGYLVEYGKLDLRRFHKYLEELSKFEQSWFEEREADFRWIRGKRGERMAKEIEALGKDKHVENVSAKANSRLKDSKIETVATSGTNVSADLIHLFDPTLSDEPADVVKDKLVELLPERFDKLQCETAGPPGYTDEYRHDDDDGNDVNDDDDDVLNQSDIDEDLLIYRMHRRDYYSTKLGFTLDDVANESFDSPLLRFIFDYIRMLQWILDYYFLRVADWNFYYCYHYAPFVMDLVLCAKQLIMQTDVDAHLGNSESEANWTNFSPDSQPVLPFMQQLMILPPDCAYIVPAVYQDLMTSSTSPLALFFPTDFETDLNGKISSWEAVVLIPFMDEKILSRELSARESHLTSEEINRNKHKCSFIYRCDCEPVEVLPHNYYRSRLVSQREQMKKLYASTRCVVTDFPSLSRLPFTHRIQSINVQVFNVPSKHDSMVLTLERHPYISTLSNMDSLVNSLLGRPVRIGWPFATIVMPVRVMTVRALWELTDFNMDTFIDGNAHLPTGCINHRLLSSSIENSSELDWLKTNLHKLKYYLRNRRAILLQSNSDEPDANPYDCDLGAGSVLIFSKSLVGWSLTRNKGNKFCLAPHFMQLRASNGNDLRLDSNVPLSSSSSSTSSSRRRSDRPAFMIEPASGLCDGLNLDLLDVVIPDAGVITPHSIKNLSQGINVDFARLIELNSLFHPGKIVTCFSKHHYGCTGEVVSVSNTDHHVLVRFYSDRPATLNLSNFRKEFKFWNIQDYIPVYRVSRYLNVPVHVIHRFIRSFYVDIHYDDDDADLLVQTLNPETGSPCAASKDNKRQSHTSIGLNLIKHKTFDQVLGWSRYCPNRHIWLFSTRTVNTLNTYRNKFSQVWDLACQISSRDDHKKISVKDSIAHEIIAFIKESGCRSAPVLPCYGLYLDETWLQELCNIFPTIEPKNNLLSQPLSANETFDRRFWTENTLASKCSPQSLFVRLDTNQSIYPIINGSEMDSFSFFVPFTILDQVIYIASGQNIPVGLRGVIIGLPSANCEYNNQQYIEVMFEKAFPGALDIRGSGLCCAAVRPSCLLKIPDNGLHPKQPQSMHWRIRTGAMDKQHHAFAHELQTGIYPRGSYQPSILETEQTTISPPNQQLHKRPTGLLSEKMNSLANQSSNQPHWEECGGQHQSTHVTNDVCHKLQNIKCQQNAPTPNVDEFTESTHIAPEFNVNIIPSPPTDWRQPANYCAVSESAQIATANSLSSESHSGPRIHSPLRTDASNNPSFCRNNADPNAQCVRHRNDGISSVSRIVSMNVLEAPDEVNDVQSESARVSFLPPQVMRKILAKK